MAINLHNIFAVLFRPLLFIVYFVAGFSPRNPRRWVFGSWSGMRFADNTAALFEYAAARKQDGIEVIWVSRDPRIVKSLRERNLRAHATFSPAGIWVCLTGGVFVFDGLTRDVNHWLSRGAKRVLLRHGVGIKVIERAIKTPKHRLYQLFHGNILQRLFWTYLLPWHAVTPDFSIATSKTHLLQGALYFGMQPEALAITGFPRNDQLLEAHAALADTPDHAWLKAAQRKSQPVFLYLPTFRDDAARFSVPWQELDAIAGRAGVRLLVKLHLVDTNRGLGDAVGPTRYLRLADPAIDCNSLFQAVDGLISDYSSATFDFILTRKPVIFFVPDLDDYLSHSRSFYFDYADVTPGAKVKTPEALEQAIVEAAAHGIGQWKDQYEAVLDQFHVFRDARARERTYHEIRRRLLGLAVPDNVAQARVMPADTESQKCAF
jgi:CDP-glycerol glycerophosphotransferase (TagB/SpsB family)